MFDVLKKFDAFPKASDDFRLKTTSGAIGKFRVVDDMQLS